MFYMTWLRIWNLDVAVVAQYAAADLQERNCTPFSDECNEYIAAAHRQALVNTLSYAAYNDLIKDKLS